MGINSKKSSNILKVLLVALAFTFSSNVSAIASTTTSSIALVGGNNNKSKKKKKKKRKHRGDKIPLDGGLSILVLGAAAFGVKKLRDKRNDKS